MEWYWPDATQLAVTIRTESRVLSDRLVTPDADGIWRIDADIEATTPVDVRISPLTLPKN